MLTHGARHLNLLIQYGEITTAKVEGQAEVMSVSTSPMNCITPEVFAEVSMNPEEYRLL
jgi:hypothetical protein